MRRNFEKRNAPYVKALREFLVGLGATEETDKFRETLVFQTVCGTYTCTIYPNNCCSGAWVAGHFEDVPAAVKHFGGGFDTPVTPMPNPYTGKWNHHFFDVPVEDALRSLRHQLGKVLDHAQNPVR